MLKYIGQGNFLAGIPARDLSDAEVKEYGGEIKLISTGLYKKVIDRETYKEIDKKRSKEKCQE